jgi:hypothetical protein
MRETCRKHGIVRNAHRVLVGNPKWKVPLGRLIPGCEVNILYIWPKIAVNVGL